MVLLLLLRTSFMVDAHSRALHETSQETKNTVCDLRNSLLIVYHQQRLRSSSSVIFITTYVCSFAYTVPFCARSCALTTKLCDYSHHHTLYTLGGTLLNRE